MIRSEPVIRDYVPLDQISPNVIRAVIMSEDGQFCQHHGIDWTALELVLDHRHGPNRGASTLTMQVAKNMMLWPGRSYLRKLLEMPLALILDFVWGKRRILEIYLNIAEWGDHIYGIEAAARHEFHVSARTLTPRQAALLATSLPNPLQRRASRPSRHQVILAGIVEARMRHASEWLDCAH